MQLFSISDILPETLAGDSELDSFIENISDNTLINARISHQIQFEQFVCNLKYHEPLTLPELKILLSKEPVEIRFLFAYNYSMFMQRCDSTQKHTSLSDFLYTVLIHENPERLHWQ